MWCPAESQISCSAVLISSNLTFEMIKKGNMSMSRCFFSTVGFVSFWRCRAGPRYPCRPPSGQLLSDLFGIIATALQQVLFSENQIVVVHLHLLLMPTSYWTETMSTMNCFLLTFTSHEWDDMSLCENVMSVKYNCYTVAWTNRAVRNLYQSGYRCFCWPLQPRRVHHSAELD